MSLDFSPEARERVPKKFAVHGWASLLLSGHLVALVEPSMNWQSILENLPDLVLVTHENGGVVRASQGFLKILGHEPEALVGTDIDDLFGDGEMLSMLGIDSVFEDEDEIMDLTMLLRHVDGRSIGCLTSGKRVQIGDETYFVLVARPHGEIQEALAQSSREAAAEREQRALLERILNTLVDAVFMVDREFVIQPLFSKSCERIFQLDDLNGVDANELLFGAFGESDDAYQLHLAAMSTAFGEEEFAWYFNDHVFMENVEYRPPNADPSGPPRLFQLRYAPLLDDAGLIYRVLFIVSDITELRALRTAAEVANRRASIVIALSEGDRQVREMFFSSEAERIVNIRRIYERAESAGALNDKDRVLLMRALHTIKGNSKLLKFEELSEHAHVTEYAVLEEESSLARVGEHLNALETHFNGIVDVKDQISGGSEDDATTATLELLSEMLGNFENQGPIEMLADVRSLLNGALRAENVSLLRTLSPLESMSHHLADRLEKKIVFHGIPSTRNDVYMPSAVAQSVLDAMTHGIRNALDHGIETTSEREGSGKNPTGTVFMSLSYDNTTKCLQLAVDDDGKGIDLEILERRGRERGLITDGATLSADELRQLVFAPGFSTREQATDISGRGVGLDAARERLRQVGGDVTLQDNPTGTGSRFCVLIPSRHLEVAYVGGRVVRGNR
jgi:two-component system, chemotaxis family, sensor kinase CheA